MVKQLKNYEVLNIIGVLRELMEYDDVPTDAAWNLKKNMKKLESIFKIYAETEKELVQKYAIKDEELKVKYKENGQPMFTPANEEKFIKERNELLNCNNEISFISVKESELRKLKKVKPAILFDLDFMIEDDIEPKK